MSQRSKASMKAYKDVQLPTGATPIRSAAHRAVLEDMCDSLLFLSDFTVKVSLTSAEILALNTTPKQLVAAPGASKMINLHNIKFVYTFVSAAYATNTNLRVLYGTTANTAPISSQGNIISGANDLTAFIGATNSSVTIANTPLSSFTNAALNLTVVTGDPTAGDSTMDVYVTYSIINL